MYGLLLESICEALKAKFGEAKWQEIRQKAGVPHNTFVTHKTYSETLIPRITRAAHEMTGCPVREIMDVYGKSFVGFVGHYGYDQILRVLGRHMRDFLNGLDNLHEYLRFSYPKLKPPSFFCENETKHGLTLHYRSRRKGYLHYVIGQIRQVGQQFYNTPIEIEVVLEEETLDMTHVVMQLHFDNTAYKDPEDDSYSTVDSIPISSEIFFDVFPFHIVFNQAMIIRNIGCGLDNVMPHIIGQAMDEMFTLTRPMVEFNIENVLMHTNNVFELTSAEPIRRVQVGDSSASLLDNDSTSDNTFAMTDDEGPDDTRQKLRLKGQMMFMVEWQAVIFLGTPIMENLDKMFETGLYINDLSMHDSSRDLVLAGTQQSAELKLALDQEQQKSKKLEESMRKLDVKKKKVPTATLR